MSARIIIPLFFLALLSSLLLNSCLRRQGTTRSNPPSSGAIYDFNAPSSGQVLTAATTLSVSGNGLASASFEVDGNIKFDDHDSPFEWVFDPEIFRLGDHVLTIKGRDDVGKETPFSVRVKVARPPVPVAEIQNAIASMQPGEWYEIRYSHLRDVGYHWLDPGQNVAAVMNNVSGGAYDTKRNRLVIFGGGQIYAGNEIYVFDMNKYQWERITDPSPFPPGEEGNPNDLVQHPDGSPVSRETYDQLAYIPPPIDRFFLGGGTALWRTGQFWDFHTYFFDFDTLKWEIRTSSMTSMGPGSVCAVAPDGRVWMHGTGSNSTAWPSLSVFDPITNIWTRYTKFFTFYDNRSTAEIDPVRNKFVAVGRIDSSTKGTTYVWDLSNPSQAAVKLATTGDVEIEQKLSPGLAYHPGRDRMVSWSGGIDVYLLDLDNATWTRVPGTGTVDPGSASPRGTFGRWAYIPAIDRFIIVNSVDTDVFIYRL